MKQNLIAFFLFIISSAACAIEGMEYKNYNINGIPAQVLTLDINKVKIIAVRSQDVGDGLYTVQEMAEKFSALAAINGGFFRFKEINSTIMLPAGVLRIANQWHGIAYKSRGAFGWDPDKNLFLIDRLQTRSIVNLDNQIFPINAINTVSYNKSVLFSNSYKEYLNKQNSLNIVIVDDKVTDISNDTNITIPAGAYVYKPAAKYQKQIAAIRPGDSAYVDINIDPLISKSSASVWNKLPYIVGGGPMLISDSEIIKDFSDEKLLDDFINADYARTAVGILPHNKLVFVVTGKTSIPRLAQIMQRLGCIAALNLDGGGSSDMYVAGANESVGRAVADSLLVLAH